MPDAVPFPGLYRLLPIYIGKIPIRGKNLSVSFQLVLRVPPSPSLYNFIVYLPYILYFLGILEDLEGSSRRVQQFTNMPPIARRRYLVPKGLEGGVFFNIFLLNLIYYLKLLEDSLVYKLLYYYIQASTYKEYLGNIIYTYTSKQLVSY